MNPLTDGSEAACQETSTVNGGAAAALFSEDVIHTIFGFLDGESLLKANCCCKTWSNYLKQPTLRASLSNKFHELPVHIDPLNGDDNSTSGSCIWPFKTIARAEQWMQDITWNKMQRRPKCSGFFRPFLLPDAFDFKEVRFHCVESCSSCTILQCSVGGRLACHRRVCSEHGIGWGRWIKNSATDQFFICFDSDAFVCQMFDCKKASCEKHCSTLFRQCDVCLTSSAYAKICRTHSQQCLRYVNADRQGLGAADYRDDFLEWDGHREICGAMIFRGCLCDWFLITHMILQEQSVAQCK
jgi:hypothetical protein